MKIKRTAIALAACATVLSATFVGCGEDPATETTAANEATKITSIPITGGFSLDVTRLTSEGYVDYYMSELTSIEGGSISDYYCKDSNVPYIFVVTLPKDGKTLEERAQEDTQRLSGYNAYYQITTDSDTYGGATYATYYHSSDVSEFKKYLDEDYYYVTNDIIEDGDNFVEICYFHKTEEVALGDTGKKVWIPVGYTNKMTDELKNSGVLFCGIYENDPMPDILIKDSSTDTFNSFESERNVRKYLHETDFSDSTIAEIFNMGKEANWDEESNNTYYNALGFELETFVAFESNDMNIHFIRYADNNTQFEETYATFSNSYEYAMILRSTDKPFPAFTGVLVNSIH